MPDHVSTNMCVIASYSIYSFLHKLYMAKSMQKILCLEEYIWHIVFELPVVMENNSAQNQ